MVDKALLITKKVFSWILVVTGNLLFAGTIIHWGEDGLFMDLFFLTFAVGFVAWGGLTIVSLRKKSL